jgi:hypothetical protein
MIWQLKLKSIVMLTNVIEGASRMVISFNILFSFLLLCFFIKTKCHQYWPKLNQTIIYGSYSITCIDKQCLCDYEKRYFQLTKVSPIKRFNRSNIALG